MKISKSDIDDFWVLVEDASWLNSTKRGFVEHLQARLSQQRIEGVETFAICFAYLRKRLNTWDMYGAFYNLFEIGSLDSFMDFQSWLVALGKESFEKVASDPDRLLDLPEVQHLLNARDKLALAGGRGLMWSSEEEPFFEEFDGVVYDSYIAAGGQLEDLYHILEMAGVVYSPSMLDGSEWNGADMNELKARLPHIYRYVKQRPQVI